MHYGREHGIADYDFDFQVFLGMIAIIVISLSMDAGTYCEEEQHGRLQDFFHE
jgi:hypothetical protein